MQRSRLKQALRADPELSASPSDWMDLRQTDRELLQALSERRRLYFAYGSNLLSRRIQAPNRAPGAVSLGAAQLGGHRLVFDLAGRIQGETEGGGVANIRPVAGETLWGALYWMPQAQLLRLNRLEEGFGYRVLCEPVFSPFYGSLRAHYYLAPPQLNPEAAPTKVYREYLIEGAAEQGLPKDYQERLRERMDRLQGQ